MLEHYYNEQGKPKSDKKSFCKEKIKMAPKHCADVIQTREEKMQEKRYNFHAQKSNEANVREREPPNSDMKKVPGKRLEDVKLHLKLDTDTKMEDDYSETLYYADSDVSGEHEANLKN